MAPTVLERLFGRALAVLVWIGLIRGHFYILEVRGRKSGRTISLPVDLLELDGRRYLVCARGNSNWVRNARAAEMHEADYSPWEGRDLACWPSLTMLRGKIVVENGALTGALSDGKHLMRKVSEEVRSRPAV